MQANEIKFLAFLRKAQQFIIPIYQRTYSWQEEQCEQLWDDITRAGDDDKIQAHFTGAIVYIEGSSYQVSTQSQLLVIDGQQRLTTLCLLIEALARSIGSSQEVDGMSARKLRNYYLLNHEEEEDSHFKLLLTQTDKTTLTRLLEGKKLPQDYSYRIKENFRYFKEKIKKLNEDEKKRLLKGLSKLTVVDISLQREDNPQLIFESMNSTGMALREGDLIRNFMLMGLEQTKQKELYEKYWRPMELLFGQEILKENFDMFMRNYLTLKLRNIPKIDEIYPKFKFYYRGEKGKGKKDEELIEDIYKSARYYCAFAFDKEEDEELRVAFRDLAALRIEITYPLMLQLYQDYEANVLARGDFISLVRLIESYIFRRSICDVPTNILNKYLAGLATECADNEGRKNNYLEFVKARLQLGKNRIRFPDDKEFKECFQNKDLYNYRNRSYWLRRIENQGRKERVSIKEYSIEHIMPHNLTTKWKKGLGDEWQEIHERYLHRAGNLTLTEYNSEYSNRSFAEKRDIEGGFRESPLRLNKGLRKLERWDKDSIEKRGLKLAEKAIKIWEHPALSEEILAKYKPKEERTNWTLEQLKENYGNEKDWLLIDKLRQEIMAIALGEIYEQIFSKNISYVAATNLVDLVPLSSGFNVYVNIPYEDLDDPKGIAEDVSDAGHLGTGDVKIYINEEEQIAYLIELIRQAFEGQAEFQQADSESGESRSEAEKESNPGWKGYTLDNFRYLKGGVRKLFDILDKGIREINPTVISRIPRSDYIAYKTGGRTNIASVGVNPDYLWIWFIKPHVGLKDPHKLLASMEDPEYAGFAVYKEEEVPHAISLIRQSYEWRMRMR